jgi:hypothetical protein
VQFLVVRVVFCFFRSFDFNRLIKKVINEVHTANRCIIPF